MLDELSIRDFALIDRVSVRFSPGLNLLTGETGAGKSILIGALGFLLGNKADTGIIRTGAEETLVSGVLDISDCPEARIWLADHGMDVEDGTVVIRRSLKRTGRGAVYIQNSPAVRQDLADFTALLVNIHGQHEHQSLLHSDDQRRLLDRFAHIDGKVAAFGERFAELSSKRRDLEHMGRTRSWRRRRGSSRSTKSFLPPWKRPGGFFPTRPPERFPPCAGRGPRWRRPRASIPRWRTWRAAWTTATTSWRTWRNP